MAGFFKSLFGGGEPKKERRLSHPRDLQKGDFLTFQYLPQSELSSKTFEVYKVNTYDYDGVDYPEMILKDREGNTFFMMIEEEDGEEYIGLSKKVPKAQIRDILPQEALDKIFRRGTGTAWGLENKDMPEEFREWLANKYIETDEDSASFSKGDSRKGSTGGVENFKSYTLTDPTDEYALEIEVYGENEIELSATVYHGINVIEEILPGSLEE